MGDYREYIKQNPILRSNKYQDKELKYLNQECIFGNQYRPRKFIYTNFEENKINNENNISPLPNKIQNEFEDEQKPNIITTTGHKRERDEDTLSVLSVNSTEIQSALSMSDSRLEEDEMIYILGRDFIEYDFDTRAKSVGKSHYGEMRYLSKYNVTKDKLFEWKFKIEMKKFSRKIINCFQGKGNLINVINELMQVEGLNNMQRKKDFLERIYTLSDDYGIDKVTLNKLNKIIQSISIR